MRDSEGPTVASLLILILVVGMLSVAGCYGCAQVQVSNGYRDSTVRKVSETGFLWKTWEVETLGDGMRLRQSGDQMQAGPETFNYTVTDPAILARLQSLPAGKRVRIHYRKMGAAWKPVGETKYFITAIDDLP